MSALSGFPSPAAAAPGVTVDLKVLVISVGDPSVDPGLDLMDDLLDQLSVPYDVLDSSTTELTEALLRDGDHGFYNGVIVTVADTYLPGIGGAGLSFGEWNILHQYERDFAVREAVLAGWPTTGGTPNYGMANVLAATGSTGQWTAAATADVYSYVNPASALSITDFGFSATGRGAAGDPVVTPYLVDAANPGNAMVSHLVYDDGREVLLSTISNAWFLDYSQVLAYSFLDFATSGLHLGARQVHLSAHIDDLFLTAGIWDPVANETFFDNPYRNTPADIATTVNAQAAFNSAYSTVNNFKVDFAFNGLGAAEEVGTGAPISGDTELYEFRPTRNFDDATTMRVRDHRVRSIRRHALLSYTLPADLSGLQAADLTLTSTVSQNATVDAEVCAVAEPWTSSEATWTLASAGVAWTTGGGAAYDAASCIPTQLSTGSASIDVTPIVASWGSGVANNGFVVRTDQQTLIQIASSESATPPLLNLDLGDGGGSLVSAVQDNAGSFRFLNHTFTHRDMDGSAGTTQALAEEEINLNRLAWAALGLPEESENYPIVVTGNHSGLEDDSGTELDPSDDVLFPAGVNEAVIDGFEAVGIGFMASDTSRVNTGVQQYVPGSSIVLLPRYPTAVFYNTLDPVQLEDEYNYIFHERYLEAGQDPCVIPGAICTPRTYQQILDAEAETAVRHMLTYNKFPHFFHIANIVDYDGQGSTLLFDWLEAVVTEYESSMSLPIVNPTFYEVADHAADSLAAESASISAVLNLQTGEVTLSASQPVDLQATGLAGGSTYGDKLISSLSLSPSPVTMPVAP